MNTRPKILIVHNYYQLPGGEDSVVANEKKLLEDHGHEVILYTRHNNEFKSMGMMQKLLLPFTTIYNPRTSREIKKIIRERNVEVVHVHNTLSLISPSVYYAARHCDIPVVQTVHNFRLLCPKATFYRDDKICEDCVSNGLRCAIKYGCYRGSKLQTLICVLSTCFHRMTGIYGKINYIVLTEFNKKKILQLKQIKPEWVYVKPNFVEDSVEVSERKGFIFAGRLDELKGIRVLVEAWKLMGAEAPQLTICGTGPLEAWCREETKNLNIEMKGLVPNAVVKDLIAKSQALILPTLWYEGFPMSIVEAYAVGTPVICSDLGNAGSVVEEGITGWRFQTGSAKGLLEKVYEWTDISSSVRRIYKEKYTAEKNYEMLASIYQDLKK